MTDRDDLPRELRASLTDPWKLCRDLGIAKGAQRQATGLLVLCPAKAERTPSCSVTRGPDGTVRVKCFSCDFAGDALTLVGVVLGTHGFAETLLEAARIAGRHDIEALLRGENVAPAERRAPQPAPEPEPERDYPPADQLAGFWQALIPVTDDAQCSEMLVSRRIDPERVAGLALARSLHPQTATDRLPDWARYRGVWWRDTGHRMIVPVFDSDGNFRSVRAWRVTAGDSPKRLPPGGHRASELVLANGPGQAMLAGRSPPCRVIIVEGEPDHLVRSIANAMDPVLGVLSGSWHPGFAARVPYGSEVLVRTHIDAAGERYAAEIIRSVRERAQVYRLETAVAA